jgi:hypothetical protein
MHQVMVIVELKKVPNSNAETSAVKERKEKDM